MESLVEELRARGGPVAHIQVNARLLALEPQGRWGEPDDAARRIAWLCSDDARWITGRVIHSTCGGP